MDNGSVQFIGLDIHKEYFIAVGVNAQCEVVFGPQRSSVYQPEDRMQRYLTPKDAIVLEMTANTYAFYDAILPRVQSAMVVHPPQVALVTNVPVKPDKKAALALAQLHAAGMLTGAWIPPNKVQDSRALIAQWEKMVRLSTMAKNRLQALLHRDHLLLPEKLFAPEQCNWWKNLPLCATEQFLVSSNLNTLEFAQKQVEQIELCLKQESGQDERIPLLVQLPGVAFLTAITTLAAIGDITRFPNAKKLVGYAGLGARIHDSGMTHNSGRISNAVRKDLRRAMVNAANHAVQYHAHWKKELAQMKPHLGRSKAIVAIARKLLVALWHVLSRQVADRFAEPRDVARSLLAHAYKVGMKNLPEQQPPIAFTRNRLDRLHIGIDLDLKEVRWGSDYRKLPLSKLSLEKK